MLFHSLTCISQVFVRYLPKSLNQGTSKSRHSKSLEKVQTMLVWYLLSRLRNLVYSCAGCGTSKKIYLSLEDNRSSFSRVSLKSEIKDSLPQTPVLFCLGKIWLLGNKNLKSSKLKMNKFIKYIWQFIISTSHVTLEYTRYIPA